MSDYYKVITYMRIDPENHEPKQEPMTFHKAWNLSEHLKVMQPENIYQIEPVPTSDKEPVLAINRAVIERFFRDRDNAPQITDAFLKDFIAYLEVDVSDWLKDNWRSFGDDDCVEIQKEDRTWDCYTLSELDIQEVADQKGLSLEGIDLEDVISSIKKGIEWALTNRDEIIEEAIRQAGK